MLGFRCALVALENLCAEIRRGRSDHDVCAGGRVRDRGTVIQKKTGRPVQFEITEQTRAWIHGWLSKVELRNGRYLFPNRFRAP